MSTENPKQPWDARLRDAAMQVTGHVEDDLRRLVTYINDEVVPDVRRNSSSALRAAAAEFGRLAQRMEDSNKPGAKPAAQRPPGKP